MVDLENLDLGKESRGLIRDAQEKCPECSGRLIEDKLQGETVCTGCGYVDNGKLEVQPDLEEKTLPLSYGNSSTLSYNNTDYLGKQISVSLKGRFKQMRLLDRWSKKSDLERKLEGALPNLAKWAGLLGMPDAVVTHASFIYTKAVKSGVTRRRNTESMIAACIYKASKDHNLPINVRTLSEGTGITKKSINRSIAHLMKSLDSHPVIMSPTTLLPKYANNVGLSEKGKRDAVKMLKRIEGKIEFMGKPPSTLAAGAVYASAVKNKENISQVALGRVSHVTSVTIRKNYKMFLKA